MRLREAHQRKRKTGQPVVWFVLPHFRRRGFLEGLAACCLIHWCKPAFSPFQVRPGLHATPAANLSREPFKSTVESPIHRGPVTGNFGGDVSVRDALGGRLAELVALQAEADALKRLQAKTAVELDALLPAILDRAFKGEL